MIGTIITILLIVLLFILITAPFEALEWWADWFEDDPSWAKMLPAAEAPNAEASCYIVYLTGIGSMEPDTYAWREQQFFERLTAVFPHAVLVKNIFPYSMNNVALTGNRFFSWLWRIVKRVNKKKPLPPATILINIRNISQVAVSIDHRYGPIYNLGSANLVRRALTNQGYPFDHQMPIYLIGYSGGGQIATGVVPYLKRWITAPIYVISIGGVFGSGRGHIQANHYFHIVGQRDKIERLGRILFPRRWSIWRTSHWNQAVATGNVDILRSQSVAHTGRRAYLDPKNSPRQADGNAPSYLDETMTILTKIIEQGSRQN